MTVELNALSGARPVRTRNLSFQGTQLQTGVLTGNETLVKIWVLPTMATLLQRETFSTSRLLDFFSEKELEAQCGHIRREWPLVILKELDRQRTGRRRGCRHLAGD